jgi:hypothetical protein
VADETASEVICFTSRECGGQNPGQLPDYGRDATLRERFVGHVSRLTTRGQNHLVSLAMIFSESILSLRCLSYDRI